MTKKKGGGAGAPAAAVSQPEEQAANRVVTEAQSIQVRAANWDEAAKLIRKEVGKDEVIMDLHRIPNTQEGAPTWEYEALVRAKRRSGKSA